MPRQFNYDKLTEMEYSPSFYYNPPEASRSQGGERVLGKEVACIMLKYVAALCRLESQWPESDLSPCQTCLAFG